MGEVDRGGFNRSEVEARLALSHSLNQVGRDLEVTLAVSLGGQAAGGAIDDFQAVARLDGRAGDIAGPGDFAGDARRAPPVGHSPAAGRGTAQASETVRVMCFGLVGQSWALGSAEVKPLLTSQSIELGEMRLQHAGWVSSELGRPSNFSGTQG